MKSLKEQYETSLNYLTFVMIVASILFIFVGLGILSSKSIWWIGLIIISIGLLTLLEYYFIRKYILKKLMDIEKKSI